MSTTTAPNEPELPPPPDTPDCCFSGCAQCVLDYHAEEMRLWRQQCDEIRRRHQAAAEAQTPPPDTAG